MSKSIERRVQALEERIEQKEGRVRLLWRHEDGTITEQGEGAVSPVDIGPDDEVILILSPPWDSKLLRRLTDDEMEAKFPGRRERLAQWTGILNFGDDDAA